MALPFASKRARLSMLPDQTLAPAVVAFSAVSVSVLSVFVPFA